MIEEKLATDILADDFNKMEASLDCASRMLDRANELNLFMPGVSRQSRDAMRLIREATTWVNDLRNHIGSYSAGEALCMIDALDLLHRIAYQQPADRTLVNDIILNAFEARFHGDKTVDEYLLYRAIHSRIINKDKTFFDRPLTWLCLTLDRWHKEALVGYAKTFLPTYDIINQASILLEADLYAYEGRNQKAFKQRLVANTHRYLDNYDATDRKMRFAAQQYRFNAARLMA